MTLILWTDGSASPNPGPGGYAVIDATPRLDDATPASNSSTAQNPAASKLSPAKPATNSPRPVRLGRENPSTNIRMEAHALIAAIEYAVSVASLEKSPAPGTSTDPASVNSSSVQAEPSTPNKSPAPAQTSGAQAEPSAPLCEIHTDSEFWINVLTKWAPAWRARGWRKSRGEIQNLDLVKKLYHLYTTHSVKLVWVRGHVGTPENELADLWANRARTGATLPGETP